MRAVCDKGCGELMPRAHHNVAAARKLRGSASKTRRYLYQSTCRGGIFVNKALVLLRGNFVFCENGRCGRLAYLGCSNKRNALATYRHAYKCVARILLQFMRIETCSARQCLSLLWPPNVVKCA